MGENKTGDSRIDPGVGDNLSAEVGAVTDEHADSLEELIAVYMEQDWAPFLHRLADLPVRDRRALICVALRKLVPVVNSLTQVTTCLEQQKAKA